MPVRSLLGTIAAVVLGLALALAVPVLPAIGQQSPPMSPPDSPPTSPPLRAEVSLTGTGRIEARGAVTFVEVEASCTGAAEGDLFVRVTQRRLLRVTEGSGSTTIPCGEPATVEVAVTPSRGLAPFRGGNAFAAADLAVCSPVTGTCATADDEQVVRLRR